MKSEDVEDDQENNDNVEGGEEKDEENDDVETGQEVSASVEKASATQKNEQVSSEEKSTISSYKDNKDVVLREDLKSVFGKFGTVKVC